MQPPRPKSFRVPPLLTLFGLLAGVWGIACPGEDTSPAPGEPSVWPTGDLVAVAAPTRERVVVATRDGRILRSVDGGDTWSHGRTPVTRALSDLVMVDAERGWAVGRGTVLSTGDGGALWERQRLPGRAAVWDLVAVAAIDEARAVAVAADGRWIGTTDGGGHWRAPPTGRAAGPAGPTRLEDVACIRAPRPRCWAVGDRVVSIDPEREAFEGREIADAAGLPPFRFRSGGVELAREDADRLRAAAHRLARRAVDWQVEAFVTREERLRYAEDEDPSALFDRIEARAGEIVGHLEAAGIANERIEVVGAPPWGYEEHLDDDPGFLDRYWAGRLAPAPSVSVRAEEAVDLRAVHVSETGLVVADGEGRLFLGAGERGPLVLADGAAPHGLLALASGGRRLVGVGRQGGLFVLRRGRPGFDVVPGEVGPGGAVFETLRAVAFVPDSEVAWAVGDAGRIVFTGDGGHGWSPLEPPRASSGGRAAPSQGDRKLFR